MSLDAARQRLAAQGLIERHGKGWRVTEAGEAWTDEQIDQLKQGRLTDGR